MAIPVTTNFVRQGNVPFLVSDTDLRGGFRCVFSTTERDAIPIASRVGGMVVRVVDNGAFTDYTLPFDNLSNAAWYVHAPAPGGGEVSPSGTSKLISHGHVVTLTDLNCLLYTMSDDYVEVGVADEAWPEDAQFTLLQGGNGRINVTFVRAGSNVLHKGSGGVKTASKGSAITARITSTTTGDWAVFGDLYETKFRTSVIFPVLDAYDPIAIVPAQENFNGDAVYVITDPNGLSYTYDFQIALYNFSSLDNLPKDFEFTIVNNTARNGWFSVGGYDTLTFVGDPNKQFYVAQYGSVTVKLLSGSQQNYNWMVWGDLVERFP